MTTDQLAAKILMDTTITDVTRERRLNKLAEVASAAINEHLEPHCEYCGSDQTELNASSTEWQCGECGYEWEETNTVVVDVSSIW